MQIYILPVSGGGFAVQLGLLKEIYRATKDEIGDKPGMRPDLVLASSGGNVASYVAMIDNWTDTGIIKTSSLIDSSLFVESWTPPFFPTWLAFPLTRSVYRNGEGVKNFFNKVFTTKSIQTTEIWTGSYNTSSQKAAMFCNKSIETSRIKDYGEDTYIYDLDTSIYFNGDVTELGKASYASASIPYLTPGVVIRGNRYVDGGAGYASPLIPLSSRVTACINQIEKTTPIQIHYFCSYDMDSKFTDTIYSTSIGLLIHSSLLQDRAFAVSLLQQYGKVSSNPQVYLNLSTLKFREIMTKLRGSSYVMLLFPKGSPSVSITSFTGDQVEKIINSIENNFSIYVWEMTQRHLN